jgi:hypothetical protein
MARVSIIAGVMGAFVVSSAPPASAEKLTLVCTFEGGTPTSGGEPDVNPVIFDTDRPRVDLRVAQTMGTNIPVDKLLRTMQNARTAYRWCRKVQKSVLLLSATATRLSLVSTGSRDC